MRANHYAVVTESRASAVGSQEIIQFTRMAGLPYVERRNRSLERIRREEGVEGVIVWQPEGPVLYCGDKSFFYHPNMGKNRITQIRRGGRDVMADAMRLRPGMKVLDCTMGLGSDALVISYLVGTSGKVVALESSPLIAAIVAWGMKKFTEHPKWLKESLERIEIKCVDHYDYLLRTSDNSFDIVYFDPMFREPVWESAALEPMRKLANHDELSLNAVREAKRVANRRVVIKERCNSPEFERLGVDYIVSGKKSTISYGIIEIKPNECSG